MISRRSFFFGAPAVLVLGAHMKINPRPFMSDWRFATPETTRLEAEQFFKMFTTAEYWPGEIVMSREFAKALGL